MATVDFHQAWVSALEELELDVGTTEALLRTGHQDAAPVSAWRPPADLGPLPMPLRSRAEAILHRQTAVAEQLARAITANRQQSAYAARLDTGRATPRPAYVDRAF
jgi:hypothetical protein